MFDTRYSVKKEKKFSGKTYHLLDRIGIQSGTKIETEVARLRAKGWLVRTVATRNEHGFMVVDIYIRKGKKMKD